MGLMSRSLLNASASIYAPLNMTNALRTQVEAAAVIFANQVMSAIRGGSLKDILFDASRERAPVGRGPGRPKGAKNKTPTSPSSAPTGGAASVLQANVTAIVGYVKAHPGQSGEVVRKTLGIERGRWSPAVRHSVEAKLIRREGENRGAKYWAA
jgi:hypothetical protein